jgi:predicted GNAT family N-acyltransferase
MIDETVNPYKIRSLTAQEHDQALDLWTDVFTVGRPFFERYYDVDPHYQIGDTFGAWNEQGKLVSAVHLCRRPVDDSGRPLMCGGIANVATRSDCRGAGLSSRLLLEVIKHMERNGIDYSLLGTGVAPHYAKLGWEVIPQAVYKLSAQPSGASPQGRVDIVSDYDEAIRSIYNAVPRPVQFQRSAEYFATWTKAKTAESGYEIVVIPGKGYALVKSAHDGNATIAEFRAVDRTNERDLLLLVAKHLAAGGGDVGLEAAPQFCGFDDLLPAKIVRDRTDSGMMVRNIRLSEELYSHIKDSYRSQRAVWWATDHF